LRYTEWFLQATFENWECEFLQMALLVVLTIFLYQKGSSESKDPESKEPDREPNTKEGRTLAGETRRPHARSV